MRVNYLLAFVLVVLVVNLFFPLNEMTGKIVSEDLSCEINGNPVQDVHLCCSEMSKFLDCSNGICEGGGYDVLADEAVLKYCEKEGYNVRF